MNAKTLLRIALLVAATLLLAGRASAEIVSSSFQITASVAKKCRITATSGIAITTPASAWDPTTGTLPAAVPGTITVSCTKGTPYTIELNGGTYTGLLDHATTTDKLPFKLYAGDCASDFTPVTVTATSRAATNTTICAGLDPAQTALLDTAAAGDYSKTIAIDITF
jgi:spore coat protein U-like protein